MLLIHPIYLVPGMFCASRSRIFSWRVTVAVLFCNVLVYGLSRLPGCLFVIPERLLLSSSPLEIDASVIYECCLLYYVNQVVLTTGESCRQK